MSKEVPLSDKPTVVLAAMLGRVADRADKLHEDLHELGCELSHEVSHWIKKTAKLTAYVELEVPAKDDSEVQDLLARNLTELDEELIQFRQHAHEDAPMQMLGQILQKLLETIKEEWKQSPGEASDASELTENFASFEDLLADALPTARADIAVRHAYIALADLAKFWRALDDRLASLLPPHELNHSHKHPHEHLDDSDD
ncbi:MAG TPA: hypothetical protein VKK79_20285 [Candidatus Lokiarchaeia archaeon]|nr:hypothetical protein [Candidatus Lokiarchaeia archaeon]